MANRNNNNNFIIFLAEREEGRLKAEVLRLEKELDTIKERKNVYEVFYHNFTKYLNIFSFLSVTLFIILIFKIISI